MSSVCVCAQLKPGQLLGAALREGPGSEGPRCSARWICVRLPLPLGMGNIGMCHLAPRASVLPGLTSGQLWASSWVPRAGCSDVSSPIGGRLCPFSLGCCMGQVDPHLRGGVSAPND